MGAPLYVLYRGPLSSCNYDCPYCPFAKHKSSREELAADRKALERFVAWAEQTSDRALSILFTPWGEALIRRSYQRAIVRLSRVPHVVKVAIQTNLSCRTAWLAEANLERVGLWVTFHPGEVAYERFLARCRELTALGARYSVGMVGLREHLPIAQRLRADLPPDTYLWINAYKSGGPGYYDRALADAFAAIDPLFSVNATRHRSLGEACRAGASAISVDGEGNVRRCHFVPEVLGNLYRDRLDDILGERPCPNATCGCHIGYVHLDRLRLYPVFREGLLERIPAEPIWQEARP
ncbi:MAG TPA: STM4011 family radical SAM protein [Sandaracinaceae bacterium]